MLKLSKSRKKSSYGKIGQSHLKPPKNRPKVQHIKLPSKNHHHNVSTLSLIQNQNHNASQCSLLANSKRKDPKKTGSALHKNRESSKSLLAKGKNKKVDKKSKNKTSNQNHNKSINQQGKSKPLHQPNKNTNPAKVSPHKLATCGIKKPINAKVTQKNTSEELYQRVNIGLYNSKTHSQINFSNSSSMREHENQPNRLNCPGKHKKKALTIDCSDQFILNQYFTNSRIRQPQQKKIEAAIKIQKVFRGYLTRKMLRDYIQKQQAKLKQLSRILRSGEQEFFSGSIQTPNEFLYQEHNLSNKSQDNPERLKDLEEDEISLRGLQAEEFMNGDDRKSIDEESSIQHDNYDSINKYISINDSELYLSEHHRLSNSKFQQIEQIHENQLDEIHKRKILQKYSEQIGEQELFENEQQSFSSEDIQQETKNQGKIPSQQYERSAEGIMKSTKFNSYQKEQPIPTDFSQKKIHQFQSNSQDLSNRYSCSTNKKVTKKEIKKSELSHYGSEEGEVASVIQQKFKQKQKDLLSFLKKQSKEKWGLMIQMLSSQITKSQAQNEDISQRMNQILQFSKKNKEQLQKSIINLQRGEKMVPKKKNDQFNQQKIVQPSESRQSSEKKQQKNKRKDLKIQIYTLKKPIQQDVQTQKQKAKKNQDMPLIRRKNSNPNISNLSLLENTQELKKFYQKNMSIYPIEEMIQIREKALEKREKEMLNSLNQELQNSKLSHQEFLFRLAEMQSKFSQQKQLIMKAKMDIFMGNRAAHKLVQDSFIDARYLGYKVPFSQSYRELKGNGNIWIKEIIVDELKQFSKMYGNSKKQIEYQENSSSLNTLEKQFHEGQPKKQYIEDEHNSSSKPLNQSSLEQQSRSITFSHNSLMEEDISYQEYDVENQNLDARPTFALEESFEDSDEQLEGSFNTSSVQKFRKVVPHSKKMVITESQLQHEDLEPKVSRKVNLYKQSVIRAGLADFQGIQTFKKHQMTPRNSPNFAVNVKPHSQVYKIAFDDEEHSSSSESLLFNEQSDIPINEITKEEIDRLVWEAAGEIFQNSHLRITFCKSKTKPPNKISSKERIDFIGHMTKEIPSFDILKHRINQKMAPTRLQLLKFMRVIIDEQEEQNEDFESRRSSSSRGMSELQEIGKYELIIPPETLLQVLEKHYGRQNEEIGAPRYDNQIGEESVRRLLGDKISDQCIKKVVSRQKVAEYNLTQMVDLRKQIKKIQMHCVFDAFNQIVMKKRMKILGYSGIGLNQLTSLFKKQIIQPIQKEHQFNKILKESEQNLRELVGQSRSTNQKLLQQNYEELCGNDSLWVNYADQALSFAMEFVFMLEDELWCMEAAEIAPLLGFSINHNQY